MKLTLNFRALAAAVAATTACVSLCLAGVANAGEGRTGWSQQEVETISSLRLTTAGGLAADPSNAYEGSSEAIALGRALFHDPRFSANGQVSCATCHLASNQLTDSLPRGVGISTGLRRTMPIMGAMGSPFLFWDGRKDSLWSQALGPLEDAREHGSNRVAIVQVMASRYRTSYEKVFGAMPDLQLLPAAASPAGSAAERKAWGDMTGAEREKVNRIYANMGKAIAAFERTFGYGESRFDRYADAVAAGDAPGQQILSPQETRGLRVFLTRGNCVTCHNGPQLTDHAFHNTGVRQSGAADRGRYEGIRKLLRDEFNCLGPYSDAKPEQCTELLFLAANDKSQIGSFRTPGLRNVALRAPYMHAGQLGTLEDVIRHYMRPQTAKAWRSPEKIAIYLEESDVPDLVAFLGTLTGPVSESGQ